MSWHRDDMLTGHVVLVFKGQCDLCLMQGQTGGGTLSCIKVKTLQKIR